MNARRKREQQIVTGRTQSPPTALRQKHRPGPRHVGKRLRCQSLARLALRPRRQHVADVIPILTGRRADLLEQPIAEIRAVSEEFHEHVVTARLFADAEKLAAAG